MLYHFNIEIMPKIKSTYTVARNTVWQVADPYNILLCVKEGRCHIETSGEKHLLEKESCIFIPANQPYKRTPIDNELCEMMYVHFTAGETEELTEQEASAMINSRKAEAEQALLDSQNSLVAALTDIFLKPVLHRDDGKLLAICEKIKALRYGYKTDNTLFLLVYFCEMLALLSKQTIQELNEQDTDIQTVKTPYNLKKAIWYIKQNSSAKITVADLCRYCNVSEAQLTRYFKKVFHTTPIQYVIDFKMNRAREIFLNAPEMPIKSVSSDLGYDDQHYFSRLFTKVTGETPSEYKKRVSDFSPRLLI